MQFLQEPIKVVNSLLQVDNVSVAFTPHGGSDVPALKGISLEVKPGQAVGILGESGSGKTTLALSILGLLPQNSRVSGSIRYRGRELVGLDEPQLREIRGAAISIVFQEPGLALHPTLRVGDQVADVVHAHRDLSQQRCREEAKSVLAQVRLQDVPRIYAAYPHQLSAGQRQRVAIAQALACRPSLLLADEPTAALDSTVQADILTLLSQLNEQLGIALVLISHNPSVLAKLVHQLFVMSAGYVIEQGAIDKILETPAHAYTRALLRPIRQPPRPDRRSTGFRGQVTLPALQASWSEHPSRGCPLKPYYPEQMAICSEPVPHEVDGTSRIAGGPSCQTRSTSDRGNEGAPDPASIGSSHRLRVLGTTDHEPKSTSSPKTLITLRALSKRYEQRRWFSPATFVVQALDNVDLTLNEGATLALVGESGSGKSTLARCLALLEAPSGGEIWFEGTNLLQLTEPQLRVVRPRIQLIFQDPSTALNPRLKVADIIAEGLDIHRYGTKTERRDRALQLMEEVALSPLWRERLPLELSGGQRQRLAIARALALRPRVLILDEAFSGLDLPVQAQVVKLLLDLQKRWKLTYLFISHDLGLVGSIADEIAVLYQGRLVERASAEELFFAAQHPHTRALLASSCELERNLIRSSG